MFTFVLTANLWLLFVQPGMSACARKVGFDFLAFYTAGAFVHEGRADAMYDLEAVAEFQRAVAQREGLDLGDSIGPWWNPPFSAWLFVPFSLLTFKAALAAWVVLNLIAITGAVVLMTRWLKGHTWRTGALVPLLLVASCPFYLALTHGQGSGASLLVVAAVVHLWRQRQALWAGLALGLLAYKPQLAAILALMLVLDLGWRALAGLGITGAALLLVTLFTLPGSLGDYLRRLPENLHFMQVQNLYPWERHVTLKAFWRLLLQGKHLGETSGTVSLLTWVTAGLLVVALVGLAIRTRCRSSIFAIATRDRLISITLLATPLIMPFFFDYDLLLLTIPAVLLTAERTGSRYPIYNQSALVTAWAALFLWLFVNPYVAEATRVNGTVLLLLGLCAGHLLRAKRALKQEQNPSSRELIPPPARAAA